MRRTIIVVLAVLVLGAIGIATAADNKKPRPRCEYCGMYSDISSTRIEAKVKEGAKSSTYIFESIGCLHGQLADWGNKAKLESFKMLDYVTFETDAEKLLDGQKALYLYGTKSLDGSMEPYIAAFLTEGAAKAAQKKLGGQLIKGSDLVFKRLDAAAKSADADGTTKVAAKEEAGPAETVYVCPCTGDCCTDIKSDKPGECPRCGMKLVKKK
jgi:rubrerythrin